MVISFKVLLLGQTSCIVACSDFIVFSQKRMYPSFEGEKVQRYLLIRYVSLVVR